MAAGLDDGFIRGVGKLSAEHLADGVTHLKHSANPRAARGWQRHRLEYIAATNNDLAVAFGESAFLDFTKRGNLIGVPAQNRTMAIPDFVHGCGKKRNRL